MELWVRSQDREVLTKVIDVYKQADTNEIWAYSDRGIKNCLGFYKTKERALEVLDEIQTILRGKYATYIDYKTSLKGFKPEEIEHMLELMAVYQMPEE